MANRRYSVARSLLSVLSLGRNVCEISVNVNPTPLTTGSYITAGDQDLGFILRGKAQEAGPLVFDPHRVEIFVLRADAEHDFCGVQRGEDVGLVL